MKKGKTAVIEHVISVMIPLCIFHILIFLFPTSKGKDESTQKLSNFINAQKIREKLESDDFVAIKIESDSQAYMQFATICKCNFCYLRCHMYV